MGADTAIQWSNSTWTPIRARVKSNAGEIARAKGYQSLIQIATKMAGHVGPHCEHCSDGCAHCYSETSNGRCLPANGTGLPFDRRSRDLVDIFLDEKILIQPLKWRAPRKVFVCSQTDLFADFVTDEMILTVFQIMAKCPRHTFQILTKRPQRMRQFLSGRRWRNLGHSPAMGGDHYVALIPQHSPTESPSEPPARSNPNDVDCLPHVHLGVSVENPPTANERIPELLQTPAAIRFVSYEPALEAVDWKPEWLRLLDWIIIGGESGPGARPFQLEWARETIRQCKAAGVAVFMKQVGAKPREACLGYHLEIDRIKGGDPGDWPRDLQVRQFPKTTALSESRNLTAAGRTK